MPHQKKSYNLYPPLNVANVHLEKSFCVKYLSVYIDCHLTWHDHMDYVCGKIIKNINIMVKYNGSFFWNDIPQSIRDKPSKKMFRKALLRWYLAQY